MYVLFTDPSDSSPPPDQSSSLEASASISGDNPDTDGYTVTVEGSASKEIGPNGSVTFSGLETGNHQLELSGIADNCTVEGQNPRTVSVETGSTVSASYSVSCTSTTGSLEASASISGDNPDTDGYTVTVEGSASKEIGPNGSVTFSGLEAGSHQVELSDIAGNCTVDGSNPKTVSVTAGGTASASFDVSCEASGLSEVAVPSEGDWSDPTTILEPGPSGSWDSRFAGGAPSSVVKFNGTYYLYYIGASGDRDSDGGPAERSVGVATCPASGDPTDPNCWTKSPNNPILDWDNWNGGGINAEEDGWFGVSAYVDGGTLLVYASFLEQEGSNTVGSSLRLFTTTDGENLTDQGVVVDRHASWLPGGDAEAEITPAGVYEDESGTWHLWMPIGDIDPEHTNWSLVHVSGPARNSFNSGEVVRGLASRGSENRHSGGAVVLEGQPSGAKIGLAISEDMTPAPGGIDYLTFEDGDFGDHTLERTYDGFQGGQVAHYLDRQAGKWLLLDAQGEDDISAIRIQTSPL
jgi:hypothetical protein